MGSLLVFDWSHPSNSPHAQVFWESLLASPNFDQLQIPKDAVILEVGGIVTSHAARNQGVGKALLTAAITEFKPAIVLGQTKTPEAVLLRTKILEKFGYRNFLEKFEVHNASISNTKQHEAIQNAYLSAHEILQTEPEGVVYPYNDYGLSPYVPNLEKYPTYIAELFQPLVSAQKRIGDSQTILTPLISVHSSIFEEVEATETS